MRYGQLGFVYLIAWMIPVLVCADAPSGVPGDEALATATKLVKETFRKEYAASTTLPQRAALARRLLKEAQETQGEAAARYVLLCEARDIGAKAADAQTACLAIELIWKQFGVAPGEPSLSALSIAARMALTAANQEAVARSAISAVDAAIVRDEYDIAMRLAAIAESSANKSQKLLLIHECQAKTKEVNWASQEYAAAKSALETLAQHPDNADARSAAGRFKCLVKNDWERGLALLREGSDKQYRELAERDLAADGAEPNIQKETGDRWWDLGETFTGRARLCCRNRAASWYGRCLSKLTGLSRTVVEKRLEEMDLARLRELHLEPGVSGEYFSGEKFEKSVLKRIDPAIDFEWSAAPADGLPKDNFSIRWTGLLRVGASGQHTFTLIVNEGAQVFIDEKLIVEEPDGTRKRKGTSATVTLAEGVHPIRIEFHDGGGLARIRLLWQRPTTPAEEVVPARAFLHEKGR